MKYYIFKLRWSQTDDELIIVKANDPLEAKGKIKGNARYIDYYGEVGSIIE